MMRLQRLFRWSLCLMVGLWGGCGGGSGAAGETAGPPAPMVAPGTWVVLGTSTAAGVGAPPGQGWVARLAARMQPASVSIHNLARTGLLSSEALPSGGAVDTGTPQPSSVVNVDAALAHQPTLLLLSFPSNDAAAGVPAADTVAAWQQIAAAAKWQGTATLVLGTQPRPALSAAQRKLQAQTEAAAQSAFGPCHVALYDALAAPDGRLAPGYRAADGDHLNAAGHALIHDRVAEALASGRCVRLTP